MPIARTRYLGIVEEYTYGVLSASPLWNYSTYRTERETKMKISTIPGMPSDFELVLFGDDQEGNAAKATDKYQKCIKYICEGEDRYGIKMGDSMDAFWIDDFRYNDLTVSARPMEQFKRSVAQLAPLAKTGRLLTLLKGNHEKALEMKLQRLGWEEAINEKMCEELRKISGTIYPLEGSYTHKLEFVHKDGKPMFKGHFTHGRKTISSISPDPHRKRANMQYRLKLILQEMAGDCILMAMGHIHIVLVTPPLPSVYLTTEKGKLKQNYTHSGSGKSGEYIPPDHRWYGVTGSFLKTFVEGVETYSELAQYNPTELGYLRAIVRDRQLVDLVEVKI